MTSRSKRCASAWEAQPDQERGANDKRSTLILASSSILHHFRRES